MAQDYIPDVIEWAEIGLLEYAGANLSTILPNNPAEVLAMRSFGIHSPFFCKHFADKFS